MDKIKVSKQVSYLLRHDPEDLEMDENGYVKIEDLLEKLKERFPNIDREYLEKINSEGKKRYEIKDNRIRALYGHTIDIDLDLPQDEKVKELYHGTTEWSARSILKEGLKSKDRQKTHLSADRTAAEEIGKRRTDDPVILEIDVESARRDEIKFYRATDQVYLCEEVPPQYISRA